MNQVRDTWPGRFLTLKASHTFHAPSPKLTVIIPVLVVNSWYDLDGFPSTGRN